MAEQGRNWPPRKDVLDKQRDMRERQRKQDISALPIATGGGGGTTSVAVVGPDPTAVRQLVTDPSDSYTFWLPLDDLLGAGYPYADEYADTGWTVVDHLGTGRRTMLVPPDAGIYNCGAHVNIKSNAAPTVADFEMQGGPAIIGDYTGSSPFVETHAWSDCRPRPGDFDATTIFAFSATVFAPEMLGPSGNEVGFGWYITFYRGSLPSSPTSVLWSGWTPRLWAWKIA